MPTASTYSVVTPTCLYMQNHRPVEPLGPQTELVTAMTSLGQPIVFSFDDLGNLQATVAADGTAPGWSCQPIASTIAQQSQFAGCTTKTTRLGVSQDSGTGDISVLVTVTATPTGGGQTFDSLWLLTGMSNVPTSGWLTGATPCTWTPVPYPAISPVQGIEATTLAIADLRVLQVTAGTTATAIVHATGPGGVLSPFLIPLAANNPQAWSQLAVEQAYTALTDAAVGQPADEPSVGLYKIYTVGSQTYLSFMPTSGGSAVYYQATAPTALAVLPGESQGNAVTDLFVSDGTSINFFGFNASGQTPPVPLCSASWLTGCTALYAATDRRIVSLWGITEAGAAFHMQAPYHGRHIPANWSQPVPILQNIATAAVHISATSQLTRIFAVQNNAGENTLIELHKDYLGHKNKGSSHWRKRQIHLPAENAVLTLQTYTHRVQWIDQNGVPASNQPVTIATTSAAVLEINNTIVTLTPGTPVTFPTDNAGFIEVLQEASSPAAPTLTFTLVAQPSASVSIEPTAPVRAAMVQGVSTTGNATSQSWYNKNAAALTQVQSVVPQIAAIQPTNAPAPTAATAPIPASEIGNWLSDVGTFVGDVCSAVAEAIAADAKVVLSFATNLVSEGLQLIVNIAGVAFTAIVTTVEDVANCIAAVISAIGATLEDIFAWLAFVFNWSNIMQVHDQLVLLYNALLNGIGTIGGGTMQVVAKWIDYLAQDADACAAFLANNSALNQSYSSAVGSTVNAQQQGQSATILPMTDPRLSWGQSQLPGSSFFLNSQGIPGPSGSTNPSLSTDLNNLGQSLLNTLTGAVSALSALAQGNETVGAALSTLLQNAGAVLNALGAVISALGTDFSDLVATFNSALNQSITIPMFTALIVENSNISLPSPLDILCVVQAVPILALYGAAVGPSAQVANILPTDAINSLSQVFSDLVAILPVPPPSPGAGATRTKPTRAIAAPAAEQRPTPATARRLASGVGDAANPNAGFVAQLRMALGSLHWLRAYTTTLVSEIEMNFEEAGQLQQATSSMRVVLLADVLVWAGEALLGVVILALSEQGLPGELTSEYINLGCSTIVNLTYWCGFVGATWYEYQAAAAFMPIFLGSMAFTSAIAGAGEFYFGITGSYENLAADLALAGDVIYGPNEILEFVEFCCSDGGEELVPIRCGLMGVSGAAQWLSGLVGVIANEC